MRVKLAWNEGLGTLPLKLIVAECGYQSKTREGHRIAPFANLAVSGYTAGSRSR